VCGVKCSRLPPLWARIDWRFQSSTNSRMVDCRSPKNTIIATHGAAGKNAAYTCNGWGMRCPLTLPLPGLCPGRGRLHTVSRHMRAGGPARWTPGFYCVCSYTREVGRANMHESSRTGLQVSQVIGCVLDLAGLIRDAGKHGALAPWTSPSMVRWGPVFVHRGLSPSPDSDR